MKKKPLNHYNFLKALKAASIFAAFALIAFLSVKFLTLSKSSAENNNRKILFIREKEIDPSGYVLSADEGWIDLKKDTLILIEKPSDDNPHPKKDGFIYYDDKKHLIISYLSKNGGNAYFNFLKPKFPILTNEEEIYRYRNLFDDDKLIFKGKTKYKGKEVYQLDTKERQYNPNPKIEKKSPLMTYYLDIKTRFPVARITDPLNASDMKESERHRTEIEAKLVDKSSVDSELLDFDFKKIKTKIISYDEFYDLSKTRKDLKKVISIDSASNYSNISSLYFPGTQFQLNNEPIELSTITITKPSAISFNYVLQVDPLERNYRKKRVDFSYRIDVNIAPLSNSKINNVWQKVINSRQYKKQKVSGNNIYILKKEQKKSSAAFFIKEGNLISITKAPDFNIYKRSKNLNKFELIKIVKELKRF